MDVKCDELGCKWSVAMNSMTEILLESKGAGCVMKLVMNRDMMVLFRYDKSKYNSMRCEADMMCDE